MIHRYALQVTAAAAVLACASATHAQVPPVVRAPESVADWYKAGNDSLPRASSCQGSSCARNVIPLRRRRHGRFHRHRRAHLRGQTKEQQARRGEPARLRHLPYTALSRPPLGPADLDSAPTMTAMATGYKTR